MTVGADPGFARETGRLRGCWHATGRLSLDVFVDPPVDQRTIGLCKIIYRNLPTFIVLRELFYKISVEVTKYSYFIGVAS